MCSRSSSSRQWKKRWGEVLRSLIGDFSILFSHLFLPNFSDPLLGVI